jgi:hypothetical protein
LNRLRERQRLRTSITKMEIMKILRIKPWQIILSVLITLLLITSLSCESQRRSERLPDDLNWPAATQTNRPWSRWWWLGSAVDKANLTGLLTQYRDAGLGGVEICPVYGVKGYEDKFISFLSPEWIKMLKHTTAEAGKKGMGVDMTTGTGWPFGGPNVSEGTSSVKVLLERYKISGGEKFSSRIPKDSKGSLEYLLAVSKDGVRIELTGKVKNGELDWIAPAGEWTIYEVSTRTPVQKVKRAAPGGEGYVLDPYSVEALDNYLSVFDKALKGFDGKMPRCQFHDSFEYYDANWTDDFFDKFESLRGYDLRNRLEGLFGDGPDEIVSGVKCDYRETISDLHTAYIQRWTQWCHSYGSLSRNQAHGAPANLTDLYAAADIPETEIFQTADEHQIPMLKFASSAAHLKGTTLVSSESFTWLKEHFQTSLVDIKPATDLLFLGGVNHIFFHGITYSPNEANWPGWQFYASVNFGPQGGLWRDLPAYNDYVTRCQSILQSGKPDENILLYMPIYDLWQDKTKFSMPLSVHNQNEWLYPSHFYDAATILWTKGYAFDEVSDKFFIQADCQDGKVLLGENKYDVVVIPRCRLMPLATMQKLAELAKAGATILFQEMLPTDVPGLGNLDKRRIALKKILNGITLNETSNPQIQQISLGRGRLMRGKLEAMLEVMGVPREPATDLGIRFIRRTHPEGYHYFFVNRTEQPIEQWVSLGRPARSAGLMDPQFCNSIGLAELRTKNSSTQVYLQLQPGQSIILRTFTSKQVSGPKWQSRCIGTHSKEGEVLVGGVWDVNFIEGGPDLPEGCRMKQLTSWTELDDPKAKCFAGTARYTIEFDKSAQKADDWILDLGRVCESARVRLNGQMLCTLWCSPFQCRVGKYLRPGKNALEIEVTNLAANRIRDMDIRKVNWKYFYDINIVDWNYKPFDASGWPLRDSGLLGPVRLIPQEKIQPE